MLKIGIIGLGDIAQKAYLPVVSSLKEIEWHLYTRNEEKLIDISNKYRFTHTHQSLLALIEAGIQGAFVHSSTESHYMIVKQLLSAGIHVYVDKPITYDFQTSKELVDLAEENNVILMTGFNRRFAPAYEDLTKMNDINMIILQKNRKLLPSDIRTFIFDDFIHVVDTVRFLLNDEIEVATINGRIQDGLLYSVVVQFSAKGKIGLAIMNRDSGVVEEKLEIMGSNEKRTVVNLSEWMVSQNKTETKYSFHDWDSTLYKRGFEQIISEFTEAIRKDIKPSITAIDALKTHEICEEIVQYLEK
ncbi:MAG: Gfo/Idh/MocA family oxidoreductase [Bacillota bacterium]|nr:Gfo/Idh/MocA family oxidoreductase [Bacillota bacterium]